MPWRMWFTRRARRTARTSAARARGTALARSAPYVAQWRPFHLGHTADDSSHHHCGTIPPRLRPVGQRSPSSPPPTPRAALRSHHERGVLALARTAHAAGLPRIAAPTPCPRCSRVACSCVNVLSSTQQDCPIASQKKGQDKFVGVSYSITQRENRSSTTPVSVVCALQDDLPAATIASAACGRTSSPTNRSTSNPCSTTAGATARWPGPESVGGSRDCRLPAALVS